MQVLVGGGKYTFVTSSKESTVKILRHGEEWLALSTGYNAIASMMAELDAARVVLDVARLLGDAAPPEIRSALEKHRALVDDHELPSEWAGRWIP